MPGVWARWTSASRAAFELTPLDVGDGNSGVLHDRAAAAAPRRDEARMAAGIAAAHRDQDVVGRQPAMHEARLGQRMRTFAVLRVVLPVAVLTDALHAPDRTLGLDEQEHLCL